MPLEDQQKTNKQTQTHTKKENHWRGQRKPKRKNEKKEEEKKKAWGAGCDRVLLSINQHTLLSSSVPCHAQQSLGQSKHSVL